VGQMPISKTFSTYLDLLRWFAASAVVLYHFQDHHFGPDWLTRHFPSNGNGYVMVFFVISGFVIAMTAERKTIAEFAIDRSIRIYIVALPVLVITALLAFFFPNVSDRFPDAIERPTTTLFLNAAFLCQSWSLHCEPYLDEPYWSLHYEVAYYAIFGACFYATGPVRWLIVAVLCAIAGPKILILMPCWLAGVAAYRFRNIGAHPRSALFAGIGVPAALVLLLALGFKDWAHQLSMKVPFVLYTPSEGFIRAWIVAAAVAIHLWGASRLSITIPAFVQRIARHLAGMSYSLYLLHLPVLYMTYYLWGDNSSAGFVLAALAFVFSLCYAFSLLTEARRHNVLRWLRDTPLQRPSETADRYSK
jgi:peptidoglycan/LPS O-acetylase OafA/YrhL